MGRAGKDEKGVTGSIHGGPTCVREVEDMVSFTLSLNFEVLLVKFKLSCMPNATGEMLTYKPLKPTMQF